MVIFILVNIKMESLMGKVNILGKMDLSILENLRMASSMEKEDGKAAKDHKATNTRVIIFKIRSKALVFSHGLVEMFTKENTKKMKEMDMVKWNGLMEAFTKENGVEEFSMVMEKCCFRMELWKKDSLSLMFTKAQGKMELHHK
jgi:hypothetical protein